MGAFGAAVVSFRCPLARAGSHLKRRAPLRRHPESPVAIQGGVGLFAPPCQGRGLIVVLWPQVTGARKWPYEARSLNLLVSGLQLKPTGATPHQGQTFARCGERGHAGGKRGRARLDFRDQERAVPTYSVLASSAAMGVTSRCGGTPPRDRCGETSTSAAIGRCRPSCARRAHEHALVVETSARRARYRCEEVVVPKRTE